MKIGIFGNYGHSNIGDEAILRGLLDLLRKHDVKVFSDCISTSRNIHGENVNFSLSRPAIFGRWYLIPSTIIYLVKNILSVQKVIIGGGGLFNDININAFLQYIFILIISKLFFHRPKHIR